MSTSLNRITMEALELPLESRENLAYQLLRSIQDAEIKPEILDSWLKQADRRMTEIEEGKTQSIPAEEVFREMREEFG
jgi:putative addiction module component (TIGR02574 family)